jgi:hypothetical protein
LVSILFQKPRHQNHPTRVSAVNAPAIPRSLELEESVSAPMMATTVKSAKA